MKTNLKFVKANKSQKNGKTYVELVNPDTYCKTLHEMVGESSVFSLSSGDDVEVTFSLSGEGFKQYLNVVGLEKL